MPQATVKSFNPKTGATVLIKDDLTHLDVEGSVFHESGLLELRLGQRVRYDVDGEGDDAPVKRMQLVSL